jgi:hypothetical protein
MMTETDDADPTDVTLLTVRAVEPGYEQDFREWFGRVTNATSSLLPRPPGRGSSSTGSATTSPHRSGARCFAAAGAGTDSRAAVQYVDDVRDDATVTLVLRR